MSILWIAFGSHREARSIPRPAVHVSRLPSAVYDARAGHDSPQIVREAAPTRSDVRANTVGAHNGFSGSGGSEGTRGATSNRGFPCVRRKGVQGSLAQSPHGNRSMTAIYSVGAAHQGPTRPSRGARALGRHADWTEVPELRMRPLRVDRRSAPSRGRGQVVFGARQLRFGSQASAEGPIPFLAAGATGLGLEETEIITIFDIQNGDAFTRGRGFCPSYKPITPAAKNQFPTGRKFTKKILIEFPTGRKLGKNSVDIY